MKNIPELKARQLNIEPDPRKILRSNDIRDNANSVCLFQPRARKALELGLSIPGMEYNVYVAGEPGLGRTYLVENFLLPRAVAGTTPPDLVYLNNFDNPDKPILVSLPPGQGKLLKNDLQRIVKRLRRDLPRHFEQASYLRLQNKLFTKLALVRDDLMDRMDEAAQKKGFSLNIDDAGAVSLTPLVDGKVLTSEEFERLGSSQKKVLKDQSSAVLNAIADLSRLVNKSEQEFRAKEVQLAQEHAASLVDRLLAPILKKFAENKVLKKYFDSFKEDILENLPHYQGRTEREPRTGGPDQQGEGLSDAFFQRYDVNLFVDNSEVIGAPVVKEINPGFFNLLGCMERETEWGTYYTDFSLIKAGAVHRANGGFLILRVDDLLSHPTAWEGLLRCLRTKQSSLDDPTDHYDLLRTRTISPDPIPLSLKVLLIGDDETYELLYMHDERFRKIFKLKAHIQDTVERTPEAITGYAQALDRAGREAGLRGFTKDAYAELVNYSTRMAEDRERLSLHFSHLREIMIESNALAISQDKRTIDASIVKQALAEREYRTNLYQEEFLREYDRRSIKVRTQGKEVGVANGLSVTQVGDYVMGLPHQISCTVGVGHGGIMDLEREAELGGPIHTKGMMILKSYFVNLFARNKPLVLTGSLCFEQSYAQVDGDSASGAELAALLSALSNVPIRLDLAFTGAISQSGAIMAVGGVTHKVEGFFEVCRRRGLTGKQGVLLPRDNIVHLVLRDNVLQAIKDGQFHIHPVSTIEEAMESLTGKRAGERLKDGRFSQNSIYAAVDERLTELAVLAEKKCAMPRRKGLKKAGS
ncbi:MAG: AAA family ATPase [Desulfomicrobium sp.]|nr:AAA family ATPase [Pseudomonadota bacterium]MBV1712257.1 AAA family ATPase [Desulfomicrobium sp.]MBU4572894.1 AAA family ATPase [Pseudomonadota bacterium]MBU4594890.1 AAA family ATPase [Pseudomonadota bacterium]MBV1718471.1 AAA family ATPase [Desulfomicrobium sp.]